MRFQTELMPATLIRRYKRFLADCALPDGRAVTAHVANPGAMLGLAEPGMRIWLEPNDDPRKKLKYAWRLVEHEGGHFTGVDTGLPNRMLKAALTEGRVPGLAAPVVRPEVKYGAGSRIDFLLSGAGPQTWVEVKSVTLARHPGLAEFPDCVTARGAKHLGDLAAMVAAEDRAVMLYLVQRTDCTAVTLAADLDPAYARAFAAATAQGVEVLAFGCRIDPTGVTLGPPLPFHAPPLPSSGPSSSGPSSSGPSSSG